MRPLIRHYRLLLTAAAVGVALAGWALTLCVMWFGWGLLRSLPSRETIGQLGRMASATTIHDRYDQVVFTLFREQRLEVPLNEISPTLIKAVLAVEDQRFYEHAGVDLVRMAGALVANLRRGRLAQGGSTITQQLARQDLLGRERTISRKLREMLVAARIEQMFSKSQILELYLNKVYFGDGFYGIEAAARGYFGKHALALNVAESALLAGLIQAPSGYAPSARPERAIARRNVVLELMRESGAIGADEHRAARDAALTLTNGLEQHEAFGLYFKEAVRRELVDRFGWPRVSEGGLRVFSTLDADMQVAAESAVETTLAAIEARPGYRHETRAALLERGETSADYLQGALLAMDPESGAVRAMVGGRSFAESPFNRALQARRQPGSAFKPILYAAAIETGYTPSTLLTNLDDPVLTEEGDWLPEDEHLESPELTLRNALRTSSNRAAVRLIRDLGIEHALDYASRLNLGPLPAVPSIALGAGEVTLAALTTAYSTFANAGFARRPSFIRRVEDADGAVLWQAPEPADERALSPETSFLMATMLADVVNAGTAAGARARGFRLPAGGKTGTTNDYADAWFVGFTPHLVAGVWVGFDEPRMIVRRGYAADLAVPLWTEFMKAATREDPPDWLTPPDDIVAVEICMLSGARPSLGCREAHVMTKTGGIEVKSVVGFEYFVAGTEPAQYCHLHPGPGVFDRVARVLGLSGGAGTEVVLSAPPPKATEPAAKAAAASAPTATAAAEEAPKKRGFWSRLFGRGKKEKEGERKDEPKVPVPVPRPPPSSP